jgi:hypothetical protein
MLYLYHCFIFHFLHGSFDCALLLQVTDQHWKVPLRAEDRDGDFPPFGTRLGTRTATAHSKVPPDAFYDKLVLLAAAHALR